VRFTTTGEAERIDRAMRALEASLPGAAVQVTGGVNRPPMERTPGVAALFEQARALAAEDGWDLSEGLAGGASDGSFTAGMGVPTLDGIGPLGGDAHATDEHVLLDDLPRRVRLYARLLERL
jgi:glutamate carboxypeptidase